MVVAQFSTPHDINAEIFFRIISDTYKYLIRFWDNNVYLVVNGERFGML